MKKILITLILVVIGLFSISQVALADSAVLSTLPALATSTVSTSFDISVQVNPANNKACVVKGTVNFDKLTCQNITLANGIMAQTAPTCAAPSFTVGIPKCATTTQNLFTVSVKGNGVGQASVSLTGVKVIGAGSDVVFNTQGGIYNILPTAKVASSSGAGTTTSGTVKTKASSTSGKSIMISSTTSSTTSTTSEDEIPSKLSILSASALDALNSSIKYIAANKVMILYFLVIFLIINQIVMWKKNEKRKYQKIIYK